MRRYLVLALALLAAPLSVGASAAAEPPLPIEAFFSRQTIELAALSPGGDHLAMVARDHDKVGLVIQDLPGGAQKSALAFDGEAYEFRWVRWKTNDRLIVHLKYLKLERQGGKSDGRIEAFQQREVLIAVDRDGKNPTILFNDDKHTVRKTLGLFGLLDLLPKDPDHVLATTMNDAGVRSVWKVDIHSGSAELIEKGDLYTRSWGVDSDDNIVLRYQEARYQGYSYGGGGTLIQSRAPGETTWTNIATLRPERDKELADIHFYGGTGHAGQLYAAVKGKSDQPTDTRTLRIYDLKTKTLSDPVWPAAKYDLKTPLFGPNGFDFQGVCFVVDVLTCQFKDKTDDANFQAIEKFFNGDRNIERLTVSDDGRWWLLDVSGPDEPGSLYLYDRQARHLQLLTTRYPNLPSDRLGVMQRYTFKARDGTEIPGYLTLPPNAPKGPLPLVVMPHGGPEVRDEFDYDAMLQVLATRGYLVFQPDFRGSGGFGARYAEAGYGQWGRRMQDDVTDGVKALIQEGRADPSRVCIFGASYGGYAALMGGAATPELYKCVVSMAGISNLDGFQTWERNRDGPSSLELAYMLKAMGDGYKDHDRVRAVSPLTYAATYRLPVLLLHGDDDDIVPVDQSQEMEQALKMAGKDVKLLVYKTEDHPYWSDAHMTDAMTQIVTFVDAHIGPGAAKLAP